MLEEMQNRLREVGDLPELLAASFRAFESIRAVARSCEDRCPELFAAFMMAADAAVDGREAITSAPALAQVTARETRSIVPAAGDVTEVIDLLSALGTLLSERLAEGAAGAAGAGDRAACLEAAAAAGRIGALMARDGHDGRPG